MGTLAFCEILCRVLRQSRFRLVHEIYWSSRRSLHCKIYKNTFKTQVSGIQFPLSSKWYHGVFCSCQSYNSNNIIMPKCTTENSSDSKHKDKKVSSKLHLKSSSLKHSKKKKKKKSHHHKRKHSKRHSSKSKALGTLKPELILLDSSENDSDVCILYDSRKNIGKLVPHKVLCTKKGKDATQENCCKSNVNENVVKFDTVTICEKIEENKKETNENFILHEVSEQCSTEREIFEGVQISQDNQIHHSTNKCISPGRTSSILISNEAGPSRATTPVNKQPKQGKNKRSWKLTNFGNTMPNKTEDSTFNEKNYLMFNVLSYNVLCQEIMEDHMELYRENDPIALSWEYRSKLLMKEFMDFNADIMCLQEVQESHLKSFYNDLQKMGYTGLFKRRTGDKKDGVAIYFKNSTFRLIDYTTVEYYQPGVFVLNRDNVGLIVKLAPLMKPDERIVVATTHLLYNPNRHDVKLAQVQLLLAEIERFAYKEIDKSTNSAKYWPVILTGDMNFEPDTGGFQLLNMGWFRYDGLNSRTLTSEYYGYGKILGKELIPPYLGVTDTCQHLSIVIQRNLQSTVDSAGYSKDDHSTEIKLLQIYNGDFRKRTSSSSENVSSEECKDLCKLYTIEKKGFASGQLKHNLQLRSVYNHEYDNSQVSTFQNRWVVVDYIFYSNDWNPNISSKEEGNLKLVARYKMFNAKEAAAVGPIPNLDSPSDHYPLVAKFALLF